MLSPRPVTQELGPDMKSSDTLFALAIASFLAAPAFAQTPPAAAANDAPAATPSETEKEVERAGISLGEEVNDLGTTYVKETFGDWQLNCVRTELPSDPCQLYQLMQDGQGNSVAEINLFNLPPGAQAVAGASIVTPLETLLTQQVTMQIDSAQAKRYPFTLCASMGCIARVGFTQAEIDSFRKGNKGTFTIVPAMAPDQKVELTMSLKGFTDGYNAMKAANDAADKAAKEAKPAN